MTNECTQCLHCERGTICRSPSVMESYSKLSSRTTEMIATNVARANICHGHGFEQCTVLKDTNVGYSASSDREHRREVVRAAQLAATAEPLYITHRPLIRNAISLLGMRRPVAPDVERVINDLEALLDGQPTPAGAPSNEWLQVASLVEPTPAQDEREVKGVERYRVESTGKGFWPFCVRAGDGTRELFVGHRKACERVAAELATAFEDGKFAATRPAQTEQRPVAVQEGWKAGFKLHEIHEALDCGLPAPNYWAETCDGEYHVHTKFWSRLPGCGSFHSSRFWPLYGVSMLAAAIAQAAPPAAQDVSGLVSVPTDALKQVLQALTGPSHWIRELQATREPAAMFADNPINVLLSAYQAAQKEGGL